MKKNAIKKILFISILLGLIIFIWYYFIMDVSFQIFDNNMLISINTREKVNYKLSHSLKKVEWTSSDYTVATVDSNGVIEGKGYGKAVITGTVENISFDVFVTVYSGNKDIYLQSFDSLSDITCFLGEEKEIIFDYNPNDAFVYLIDYKLDNDIAIINNNKIIGLREGIAHLEVTMNNSIIKEILVRVLDRNKLNNVVEDISFDKESIVLNVNDECKIDYKVSPNDGYVYDVKWQVGDQSIIEFDNGVVKAKQYGNTKITLIINGDIKKDIDILVTKPSTGINLFSNTKVILKVGVVDKIIAEVTPNDASQVIKYTSSNPNSLEVLSNGDLIAKSPGNGTINLETEDKRNSKTINFIVYPSIGTVKNDGGIWGYESTVSYVPTRANIDFFTNLSNKGVGSISGGRYTYGNYTYDIGSSLLSYNGGSILMRMYYPTGVDLSELNTFTFLGGTGERNFGGYFYEIDKNPSIIKSRGIQILISAKTNSSYNSSLVVAATNFIREIIHQKSSAINSVGGYSLGGPASGEAAEKGDYQKLMIFDSYFENVSSNTNLKNKEIVFYSPTGDAMVDKTMRNLDEIRVDKTYKKVYLVTNSSELIRRYQNDFLILDPGTPMGSGHGYINITNAKYFMYGCG